MLSGSLRCPGAACSLGLVYVCHSELISVTWGWSLRLVASLDLFLEANLYCSVLLCPLLEVLATLVASGPQSRYCVGECSVSVCIGTVTNNDPIMYLVVVPSSSSIAIYSNIRQLAL